MLGDRYGYRPIPADILATEFDILKAIVQEEKLEGLDLIDKWYRKDNNSVPPKYVLQVSITNSRILKAASFVYSMIFLNFS